LRRPPDRDGVRRARRPPGQRDPRAGTRVRGRELPRVLDPNRGAVRAVTAAARTGSIVTLDGPAGSAKSTTARAVARRLCFRHLGSVAFYRALSLHLLDSGAAPARWPELRAADLEGVRLRVEPTASGFVVWLDGRRLGEELRAP